MELLPIATPRIEVAEYESMWEGIRSVWFRRGVVGVLKSAARRFASQALEVRHATLLARSLEQPSPAARPRFPMEIREMTANDLKRFHDVRSRLPEGRIREFENRLGAGKVGVLALTADEVAGYGWLTSKSEIEPWSGVKIALQSGEGYCFDAFTFLRFRARGVHAAGLQWRLDRLRQLGCTVAYSIVDARDPVAQTTYRNAGFVECREVAAVRLAGMRWHRIRVSGSNR